jgi:hypothetical protein
MARNNDDFLTGSGMSASEQHAAIMRASAVPASNFEGEYESIGTYNSPMAQLLKKKAWESRMRAEMPEEGKSKFLWNVED